MKVLITRKLVFPVSGSPRRLIFKGTKSESLRSWLQEEDFTFLDFAKVPLTAAEDGGVGEEEGTAAGVSGCGNILYLIGFPRVHMRNLSQKQRMQRRRTKTRRLTLRLRLSLTILGQNWVIISLSLSGIDGLNKKKPSIWPWKKKRKSPFPGGWRTLISLSLVFSKSFGNVIWMKLSVTT